MTEDWSRVGRAIEERIAALSYSKAEVIRRSGVSDKTLDGYIAGKPIVRLDKRRGVCDALAWTTDSIDRLLAGGVAIDTVDVASPEVQEELRHLRAIVEEMNARLRRLEGSGGDGPPAGGDIR